MNAPERVTLLDLVEDLGPRVANRTLSLESAVDQVVEWSNGGLTHVGAEDVLSRWETLRDGATFDGRLRWK